MTLALGKLGEYERVCIAAGIRAELVSMYIYMLLITTILV